MDEDERMIDLEGQYGVFPADPPSSRASGRGSLSGQSSRTFKRQPSGWGRLKGRLESFKQRMGSTSQLQLLNSSQIEGEEMPKNGNVFSVNLRRSSAPRRGHGHNTLSAPLLDRKSYDMFAHAKTPGAGVATYTNTASSQAVRRGRSIFGFPLIDPHSRLSVLWRFLMFCIDGVYIMLVLPVLMAFVRIELTWSALGIIDFVVGFLLFMDPIMKLSIDIVQIRDFQKERFNNGVRIAKFYATQFAFIADQIAAIPFIATVVLMLSPGIDRYDDRLILLVWILRLLRFLRGIVFMQAMVESSFNGFFDVADVTTMYVVNVCYTAVALVNIMTSLWLGVASMVRKESGPDMVTWIKAAGIENRSWAVQYVHAAFFTLTTMTTVGYGDPAPTNTYEILVAMLMEFMGVLFFAFVVGNIVKLFEKQSTVTRRANLYREKMIEVNMWMESRQLPNVTKRQIQDYYREIWVRKQEINEHDIFSELPPHLRGDVAIHILSSNLAGLKIFAKLNAAQRDLLSTKMHPVEIMPGHELCKEGDHADCLWLLAKGDMMETTLKGSLKDQEIRAPAILGQAAILQGEMAGFEHRPVTLRAVTACQLWTLTLDDLNHADDQFPGVKQALVLGMTHDLEQRMVRIRNLRTIGDSLRRATSGKATRGGRKQEKLLQLLNELIAEEEEARNPLSSPRSADASDLHNDMAPVGGGLSGFSPVPQSAFASTGASAQDLTLTPEQQQFWGIEASAGQQWGQNLQGHDSLRMGSDMDLTALTSQERQVLQESYREEWEQRGFWEQGSGSVGHGSVPGGGGGEAGGPGALPSHPSGGDQQQVVRSRWRRGANKAVQQALRQEVLMQQTQQGLQQRVLAQQAPQPARLGKGLPRSRKSVGFSEDSYNG